MKLTEFAPQRTKFKVAAAGQSLDLWFDPIDYGKIVLFAELFDGRPMNEILSEANIGNLAIIAFHCLDFESKKLLMESVKVQQDMTAAGETIEIAKTGPEKMFTLLSKCSVEDGIANMQSLMTALGEAITKANPPVKKN